MLLSPKSHRSRSIVHTSPPCRQSIIMYRYFRSLKVRYNLKNKSNFHYLVWGFRIFRSQKHSNDMSQGTRRNILASLPPQTTVSSTILLDYNYHRQETILQKLPQAIILYHMNESSRCCAHFYEPRVEISDTNDRNNRPRIESHTDADNRWWSRRNSERNNNCYLDTPKRDFKRNPPTLELDLPATFSHYPHWLESHILWACEKNDW